MQWQASARPDAQELLACCGARDIVNATELQQPTLREGSRRVRR
jgi:hypothetical protein